MAAIIHSDSVVGGWQNDAKRSLAHDHGIAGAAALLRHELSRRGRSAAVAEGHGGGVGDGLGGLGKNVHLARSGLDSSGRVGVHV